MLPPNSFNSDLLLLLSKLEVCNERRHQLIKQFVKGQVVSWVINMVMKREKFVVEVELTSYSTTLRGDEAQL